MPDTNLALVKPSSPVSAIMRAPVASVALDAPLVAIAEELAANEIGAVAVQRRDTVIGLVSERDLVQAIASGVPMETTTAADVMSTDLLTVDAHETIISAAERVNAALIRHLPVRDEAGEVIGFVSVRDLLAVLVSAVQ